VIHLGTVTASEVLTVHSETNGAIVWTNLIGGLGEINTASSLSLSNATMKPIWFDKSTYDLRFFGLEEGANISLTPNGSNIVVATSGLGNPSVDEGHAQYDNGGSFGSISNLLWVPTTGDIIATNHIGTGQFRAQTSSGSSSLTSTGVGDLAGNDFNLLVGGGVRWVLENSGGHFKPAFSNQLDLGTWALPVRTNWNLNVVAASNLMIHAGYGTSNDVWTLTNVVSGAGEWRPQAAASGEANVNGEIAITNSTRIGLIYGKADVTNLLRSIEGGSGITLTNQGTNIMVALTTTYESIYVDAGAMIPETSDGATANTSSETGNPAIRRVWDYYAFDGSASNAVQFKFNFPDNWDLSGVKMKLSYYSTNVVTTMTNVWEISSAPINGSLTSTVWQAAVTLTNHITGSNSVLRTAATPTIGVGTPAEGDLVWFRIRRLSAHPDDNDVGDANLLGVQIQYQTDGSHVASW